MRRGRVELKLIENKNSRQVTFTKRHNGLLKKAYELSVLCDVDVALVVFSTKGRLCEFCSTSSMLKLIERYRRCTYLVSEAVIPNGTQNNYQEYLKLKTEVEDLQHSQRNLLGDDLGQLSTKELEQLDNQLEMSLRQIRFKKTQIMLNKMCDLRRKGQILQEANSNLKRKLQSQEATPETPLQLSWENSGGGSSNAPIDCQPNNSGAFLHPLGHEPSLQLSCLLDQVNSESPEQPVANISLPKWMG